MLCHLDDISERPFMPDSPLRHNPLKQILEHEEHAIREADDRFIATHQATHQGEPCKLCNAGPELPFSMAFQPIVDVDHGSVIAYEALARGPQGESAASVLGHTLHNNRYSIDQRCREKAIVTASTLGLLNTSADLAINFYPNAVYEPKQCLRRTFNAASSVGFPLERIIFEVTEVEKVRDAQHLKNIMDEYRSHGLRVAIDDFGAGHSGLGLLSEFQPDLIKIDRAIVTGVDQRKPSRTIIKAMLEVCRDLGIQVIAEGVERREEMDCLCELGVQWMQGFFFAPPAFEQLPAWPAT